MSTGDVVPQWSLDRLPVRGTEVRRARRSLFGTVDHATSDKFLKDELEKQCRLDQEKWNFDFAAEKPLNGEGKRYEWEPVSPQQRTVCEDEQTAASDDVGKKNPTVNGGCREDGRLSDEREVRQSHVTDFMRKRKFSSNEKVESREAAKPVSKSLRRSTT